MLVHLVQYIDIEQIPSMHRLRKLSEAGFHRLLTMATVVLDMASCLRAIFLVYIFLSFYIFTCTNRLYYLYEEKMPNRSHFGAIVHIFKILNGIFY